MTLLIILLVIHFIFSLWILILYFNEEVKPSSLECIGFFVLGMIFMFIFLPAPYIGLLGYYDSNPSHM